MESAIQQPVEGVCQHPVKLEAKALDGRKNVVFDEGQGKVSHGKTRIMPVTTFRNGSKRTAPLKIDS
jgi:hypothetical protein